MIEDSKRVVVFQGDGTDVDLLMSADVDRADWVLAVTGLDEVNLVSCQLALTLGRNGSSLGSTIHAIGRRSMRWGFRWSR